MGPPLPLEIDSDSTKQRRIGEYVHLVEVDEHGRVTVPFQRDVIVRPGCGIRRLRGWQQYVSCRSGTPRAAERWPSRQDQPPRRRGTHVGSCALYLDAGRGDVGSSRPRRASRLGPGYVVMEMVAGDSSQEERRERRVVRAPDLIAFGPSGCRGGICIEHVIGFVRHERRLPDVGRRVATNRRCQPAHGIHSLNERGSCEIVAIP